MSNHNPDLFIYDTGTRLKLACDSSFEMTTCGNLIKGSWGLKNDSLILFCDSNKFRNDSLNALRKPIVGEQMVLIRRSNHEWVHIIDTTTGLKITSWTNLFHLIQVKTSSIDFIHR